MNLHKFMDELFKNGSSRFNLCTGVMNEQSSHSLDNFASGRVESELEMNQFLTKFIIRNGYDLSLPENSIRGFYVDNVLVLAVSTILV